MKSCDVCGTLNLKENNYCIHCGNEFILEHICPYCGEPNLNDALSCSNCSKQINPMQIDDFDILFSEYNHDLLMNAQLDNEKYFNLLDNIFARAEYVEFYGNSIKDKILNFAGIFTQCSTKARGYERGYFFFGNGICYDDRLDDSIQISTIIHELAHYILFVIIEDLLCDIFSVKTSTTLQSFIWYFLTLPEFRIMNEYYAHTVAGRFVPFGYQNYGSFNMLIKKMDIDDDSLEGMVIFGNTFANEIIVYLEKYIDDSLREEIKIQFKKDMNPPAYDSILTETDDSLPIDLKNSTLLQLLKDIFEEASQESVREELENIKQGIELMN